MTEQLILNLFKVMVVEAVDGRLYTENAINGFVTDFRPTPQQLKILREAFKPLDITTLFSVEERDRCSPYELITKQILHYVEVYGLGVPGLFNLEQRDGKVATVAYISGITVDTLGDMVRKLLYANAPIHDTIGLKRIVNEHHIDFDLQQVRNNEMRVMLFRLGKDRFQSGDDAVRYMCLAATESPLLIKSKENIKAVEKNGSLFTAVFFEDHARPLAQVFHRHKNLILAAKTRENRTAINSISRLAKATHVPVHEPLVKRFIVEALKGRIEDYQAVLNRFSIRDRFKLLNLIQYKLLGKGTDAFVIRNGKVHLEQNRPLLDSRRLLIVSASILESLNASLAYLARTTILLDPHVDYGLPVSRNQTIGQLPFGTAITPSGDTISSGIYWKNAWGARDLDLSAINLKGERTGWGQYSGYVNNPITFSGDLTDARSGAMEFMTSSVSYGEPYALFVNIYNGEPGAKFELIVGSGSSYNQIWIEHPVLRESGDLKSRGNIVGFVRGGKFVVYACRLNNNCWSAGSKEAAIVSRGLADFWTIGSLLRALGIPHSYVREPKVTYDHDLTYSGFSLDKLEALFTA